MSAHVRSQSDGTSSAGDKLPSLGTRQAAFAGDVLALACPVRSDFPFAARLGSSLCQTATRDREAMRVIMDTTQEGQAYG